MLQLFHEYVLFCEHLCSIMSRQPIELLLVEIELMSKTLMHCVTPNSKHT